MRRLAVTEKIVAAKVGRGLKWADIAVQIGLSKEWLTAACLGQMTFTPAQAAKLTEIFDLSEEEQKWLTVPPHKGSLPTAVPTDALVYRFYELVNVCTAGPSRKSSTRSSAMEL